MTETTAAKFGAQPQPEAHGLACVSEIRSTERCVLLLRH